MPPPTSSRPRADAVVVDLAHQFVVHVLHAVLVHRGLGHAHAGPLLVPREVQPGGDVGHRLLVVDPLLHRGPQFGEVPLLQDEQVFARNLPVAGADEVDLQLVHRVEALDPARGVGVAHVVERAVHARVAGAEDLVLRQVRARVAGRVAVPEVHEDHVLRVVFQFVLVVEGDVHLLERALLHVLAVLRGVLPLLRAVRLQQAGGVLVGDDLRALLRPHRVAVRVVAVVVRVQHVLDRLLGGLLDVGDHVRGLLGEVRVDDDDVVFEDDPGVVAAAERNLRVVGGDGRVAEEDAGGDLLHVVELHLRDGQLLRLLGRLLGGRIYDDGEREADGGEEREALQHDRVPTW